MAKSRVLLDPEDIQSGMFAMVHHGADAVASQILPGGIVMTREFEVDQDIKGIPLAVLAVSLPYVVGALIPGGSERVIDIRDVQLMRVEPAYVAAFAAMRKAAPAPMEAAKSDQQGGESGGVHAEVSP